MLSIPIFNKYYVSKKKNTPVPRKLHFLYVWKHRHKENASSKGAIVNSVHVRHTFVSGDKHSEHETERLGDGDVQPRQEYFSAEQSWAGAAVGHSKLAAFDPS